MKSKLLKNNPVQVGAFFEIQFIGYSNVWQVRGPGNEFVIQFVNKRNARHHALQFAYAAEKGYQLAIKQWAETHQHEVA